MHKDNPQKETNPGNVAGTTDASFNNNQNGKDEISKSDLSGLRELVEKNLKWSQIIYEQNRKINNKLLWSAVFGWFKVIIIVAPIILAAIYLQPILKGAWAQYRELLGGAQTAKEPLKQNSLDNLLQLFNLDPARQEQLKALLK
jgi:hypothetical protein